MKIKTLPLLLSIFACGFANANSELGHQIKHLEEQVKSLKSEITKLQRSNIYTKEAYLSDAVEVYAHGPAVVTSPALGVRRSAEDASDLMIMLSSTNEDLVLLHLRKKMDDYARNTRLPLPNRPIIAVSGDVVGAFVSEKGFGAKQTTTKIVLDSAEFSLVGEASPWATGIMVISYESSDKDYNKDGFYGHFGIDRAFVTIGQLEKLPFYMTIGKLYAPFGSYSSSALTSSPTKTLGRVHDNAVVFGAYHRGIDAQVFLLSGGIKANDSNTLWRHFGANLGYSLECNGIKVTLGTSILGNMAEGQKAPFSNEYKLEKTIPGLNLRARVSYGRYSLSGEYVTSLGQYDVRDLTINDKACKPMAFNLESRVNFRCLNSPSSFAVGYGHSRDMLIYGNKVEGFPEHTIFAVYGISPIKNTILGVEYRHDFNYGINTYSVMQKVGDSSRVTVKNSARNTVTAKLGVYF